MGRRAGGFSVLKKWSYLVVRNVLDFCRTALRTVFHPSSIGRQIKLDDEASLIRAVKFFLTAASAYLFILSILSYILANNVFYQYVSVEIILTARSLFNVCFQATLFYFIYRLAFRRSSSYLNIIHIWLYIGVAALVLNIPLIVVEHVFTAPPVSDESLKILQDADEPIRTVCLQSSDGVACRLFGQVNDASFS